MAPQKVTALSFTLLVCCFFILSCSNSDSTEDKKIIANPEEIALQQATVLKS